MKFLPTIDAARYLAAGEVTEAEAMEKLGFSRASITRLLADLRRAGMVIRREHGLLLAIKARSTWWPDPALTGAEEPGNSKSLRRRPEKQPNN